MTGIFIVPPVPLTSNLTNELFHLTYLSSPHYPDPLDPPSLSLLSLMDRFIGLMRIPYLYIEARRIYRVMQEGGSVWSSPELRFHSLSILGSMAEVLLWFHGKRWVILTPQVTKLMTLTCYISRMILYEHAVVEESRALYQYKKAQKAHPHIHFEKKKEYQCIRLQYISHITYLTWVSLSFISYIKGIPYPRTCLRLMQFGSFFFGMLSIQYEEGSLTSTFFQKYLPNPNIYDR